ncbi:hypothetical protein DQ04_15631000, partial [Trypanosoma grayi]|uniref:hypothetical protein n=1 Tax=Trypanosoma grayi TaxID=71804 RepID=UPI0004F49942
KKNTPPPPPKKKKKKCAPFCGCDSTNAQCRAAQLQKDASLRIRTSTRSRQRLTKDAGMHTVSSPCEPPTSAGSTRPYDATKLKRSSTMRSAITSFVAANSCCSGCS